MNCTDFRQESVDGAMHNTETATIIRVIYNLKQGS